MNDALCPNCDGNGQVEKQTLDQKSGAATFDRRLCYMCDGKGRVKEQVAHRENLKNARKAERVERGNSMRQEADARGWSLTYYIQWENGVD